MKSKLVLSLLACGGVLLVCVCSCSGWSGWRFFSAGTNPLRELRHAAVGESIEIKEHGHLNDMSYQQLTVDGIDRGTQFRPPTKGRRGDPLTDFTRLPTTYYHPSGPVGLVMRESDWFSGPTNTFRADARLPATLVGNGTLTVGNSPWPLLAAVWTEPPIGVVMMNNGTLAAYARPFQVMDIYEHDPAILRLSLPKEPDVPKFTYIADARKRGATIRVFEGAERKVFDEKAPQGYYRYLFVDTAHGHPGLVAKELLTQEALRGYFAALVEDGIVAFHTSSRDYDLTAIIAATADSAGLAHLVAHDRVSQREQGHYTSEWILVARKAEYLQGVKDAHMKLPPPQMRDQAFLLHPTDINPARVWKDGASNSLAPVRR